MMDAVDSDGDGHTARGFCEQGTAGAGGALGTS